MAGMVGIFRTKLLQMQIGLFKLQAKQAVYDFKYSFFKHFSCILWLPP